jgi:hypothetical protein
LVGAGRIVCVAFGRCAHTCVSKAISELIPENH